MRCTRDFDHGPVYHRVPKAYTEWCDEQDAEDGWGGCVRTGQQIADAIDEMLLH
jgi:hypothetical protein